jgi:hypothetical protein
MSAIDFDIKDKAAFERYLTDKFNAAKDIINESFEDYQARTKDYSSGYSARLYLEGVDAATKRAEEAAFLYHKLQSKTSGHDSR